MWQQGVNLGQYTSLAMRRALALALISVTASALAEPPILTGAKIATPPTIDGVINPDEWKDVKRFEGLYDVQDHTLSSESGHFWLAYDDKYVYFAAKLFDSQPSAIKATEYRTNVSLQGDDYVQLDLDPYGTMTDWNHFYINPKGATNIEIAGGRASKREWTGDFTAKARIVEDGWEAEARIPWQLMKLPGAGKRNIRFDFDRKINRLGRYYDFTKITGNDQTNVPVWQGIELPKVQTQTVLQLLPYSYQGYDPNGAVANGGLDLKMPLTDQMTLVGTVNPDFRNIENQVLSIDFSRFERLAGESRPFFQEGAQYYSSALTATQRIKAFDSGLNIYGKLGDKLAMGLVNTADFGHQNAFMTTMQYTIDAKSNLRFSHTNLDNEDQKNRGYLMAYSNQFGNYNIFLRGMSTQDASAGGGEERTAGLGWNQGEFNANVNFRSVSPKFLPRLGFQPETDFKGLNGSVGWNRAYKTGKVAEFFLGTYGVKYDHFDGGNYRRGQGGDFVLSMREGTQLSLNADFSQFEGVNDHTYTVGLLRPRTDPYKHLSLNYTWGEIENTDYKSIGVGMAYRPMEKLQLNLSSQFVEHTHNEHQIILSGNYDLGNDRSISGRVVQGTRDTNAYVALRRSGNAGMEYFLILGDPNARRFRSSLVLKVSYPLQLFLGKH